MARNLGSAGQAEAAEIVGRGLIQAAIEHLKAVIPRIAATDQRDRARGTRSPSADGRTLQGLTVERLGFALRRGGKRGQRPQIA